MSEKVDKDFFEITGYKLSNISYLRLFNILKDEDDINFLNIFRFFSVNKNLYNNIMNYLTYEIKEEDWPELISRKVYDNLNLWWMIYLSNNIVNPFEELHEGQSINILKSEIVPKLIREMKNISEE